MDKSAHSCHDKHHRYRERINLESPLDLQITYADPIQ